ncbi:MAG TPA: SPOR domain-containing protein [Thermoanaerobaculia bacterium]
MPKQEIVTFRLHRKGVWLIVIGGLFVAVLIFAAGYLTASWRSNAISDSRFPVPGKAVAPALPKTPAIPAPPPPGNRMPEIGNRASAPAAATLTLRVGAYATEEEAKAAMQTLTAAGLEPALVTAPTSGGSTLYLLHAGSYPSRASAAAAVKELGKRGIAAAVVPETKSHL